MAKTTTQNKLILLLPRNISQTIGEKTKNAIRQTYQAGKKYLAPTGKKEDRKYLNPFARQGAGLGSGQTIGRVPL